MCRVWGSGTSGVQEKEIGERNNGGREKEIGEISNIWGGGLGCGLGLGVRPTAAYGLFIAVNDADTRISVRDKPAETGLCVHLAAPDLLGLGRG